MPSKPLDYSEMKLEINADMWRSNSTTPQDSVIVHSAKVLIKINISGIALKLKM